MKNYIVTFTNDAIEYDMLHQQEAIKGHLNFDDNYFSNINAEIDFDLIDREVESALRNKFDNFICLAEDEDIDMLQQGLEEEYGDKFKEILVMPEAFGRLYEGDQSQPQATQVVQANGDPDTSNNSQIAPATSSYKEVLDEYLSNIQMDKNGTFDYSGAFNNIKQATNISNPGIQAFFEVGYALSQKPQSPSGKIMVKVLPQTSYMVVLNEKEVVNYMNSTAEVQFSKDSQLAFNTTKITSQNAQGIGIRLSSKGEGKISNATNIHIVLFNVNYPFKDLAVQAIQNIQSISQQAKAQPSSDVLFMICGSLPNQQFLHATKILPIATAIPDESQTLANLIKSVLPDDSCIHCGMPTPDNLASAISSNLKELAPMCRSVVIHAPNSLSGINNLGEAIGSQSGYQVSTQVDLTVDFDQKRNTTVYAALEDLVINKDNGYKKCKSNIAAQLKKDQEKEQQEIISQIQGKEAKDIEKMAKELNNKTQNGPMQQEIQSGWPIFVQILIEATIQFKKNPQEKNLDQKAAQAAKNEFLDAVLEPLKKDAASWKTALDATGFGVMASWVAKAGKALFKSKESPEAKQIEKLKDLILSDSYAIIKQQFGGEYNKDGLLEQEQEQNELQNIAKANEGRNNLEAEGVMPEEKK